MSKKFKKSVRKQVGSSRIPLEELHAIQNDLDFLFGVSDALGCQGMADYQSLPRIGKVIAAAYSFHMEVDNHGFDGYLESPSGDMAEDLAGFLQDMGSVETLALLKSVAAKFAGGRIPTDRILRSTEIESLPAAGRGGIFHQESERYQEQSERIIPLLRAYLKNHWSEVLSILKDRAITAEQRLKTRMASIDQEMKENLDWLKGLSPPG